MKGCDASVTDLHMTIFGPNPPVDCAADSMEYLLRTMFSDVPRRRVEHSPRGLTGAGTPGNTPRGAQDGSVNDGSEVKCVPEKRALHVEVVLKRLKVPAEELAASINLLNADGLKVSFLYGPASYDC